MERRRNIVLLFSNSGAEILGYLLWIQYGFTDFVMYLTRRNEHHCRICLCYSVKLPRRPIRTQIVW